jgi:superfamily II DNA/RNA helicase
MAEDFIHRVGRTGRAGSEGHATSLVAGVEVVELRHIERTLQLRIERMQVNPEAPGTPRRLVENTLASRTLTRLPGEVFV